MFNTNRYIMPVKKLIRILFRANYKACLQEEVLFQDSTLQLPVNRVQEKYNELIRIIDKQNEEQLTLRERFFLTQYFKSYQNEINGLSLRRLPTTSGEPSK